MAQRAAKFRAWPLTVCPELLTDAGTLVTWIKADLPDSTEIARNARIVEMLGAGNPLVAATALGM